MLFLLLVASASLVFAADAEVKVEVEDELKPSESVHHMNNDDYSFVDGLELMRHRERQLNSKRHRILGGHEHRYNEEPRRPARDELDKDDHPGPVILRNLDPLRLHGHPDIEAQNRIIEDVFSPDFYQPIWILDYRYLKTGGRDYTRSPGGQILILPKGVRTKEHKEFNDYDAYLEHLRLSRLAKQKHHRYGHEEDLNREWQDAQDYPHSQQGHEHSHGHDQVYERSHGQDRVSERRHGQGRVNERSHGQDRVLNHSDGQDRVHEQSHGQNLIHEQNHGHDRVLERSHGQNYVHYKGQRHDHINDHDHERDQNMWVRY